MISPVILVRLMPVADFGRYREFLMYSGILTAFATLSFSSSLLYFLGIDPRAQWGYVRRIAIATGVTTLLVLCVFGLFELVTGGRLMGDLFVPMILYTVFVSNIDFWEHLWLAQHRAERALAYTAARLILRSGTTVVAAALTRDVWTVVWALVAMEALRFGISAIYWRLNARRDSTEPVQSSWRSQLGYSIPAGLAVAIWTLVSFLGGIFVSQMIGGAAMAFLSVGGYVLLIVPPLRNAVSDVLLPELAGRVQGESGDWLELWNRATALFSILLVPLGLLLARFAHTIVTFVFSEQYAPAVPVFQLYCIIVLIGWMDISLALRALNKTRFILSCVIISVFINAGLLWFLVPWLGIAGAGISQVVTEVFTIVYLLTSVSRVVRKPALQFIPWRTLGKVWLASLLAILPTLPPFWTRLGVPGAMVAGVLFLGVYVAALHALRVQEAIGLLRAIRSRIGRGAAPGGAG